MRIYLGLVVALLYMDLTSANVLTGTLYYNGDGTYAITAEDEFGHRFVGIAELEAPESTLDITIRDGYGKTYKGKALENDRGEYDAKLLNLSSGKWTMAIFEKN